MIPKLDKKKKWKLTKNFSYLALVQLIGYGLPLATLPVLTRSLGVEVFGGWMFLTAIAIYFGIIVEWGLNTSSMREISKVSKFPKKILEITRDIIFLRVIIGALLTPIVLIVGYVFEFKIALLFLLFLQIVSQNLIPIWPFMATEKNGYTVLLALIPKLIYTIIVLACIRTPNDVIYIPIIGITSNTIATIIGLILLVKIFKIKLNVKNFNLIRIINYGKNFLLISLIGNVYSQGQVLILGIFAPIISVGYYTSSQKISWGFFGMTLPLSQAIYPTLINYAENKEFFKLKKSFLTIIKIYITLSIILITFLTFYGEELFKLITGFNQPNSWELFMPLIYVSFITGLNTIISPYLVVLNLESALMKISVLGSIVFIVVGITLSYFLGGIGMAITMGIVEILIFIAISKIFLIRILHEKNI